MNKYSCHNDDPSSRQIKPSSDVLLSTADDTAEILCKAHHILHRAGQPLAPETMWIENLYLNSDCISLFKGEDGYLSFIQTVTEERFNVSLPDQADDFFALAKDCHDLYTYIPSEYGRNTNSSYTMDLWKSDIRKLFENLKTPYYLHYAKLLKLYRKHFKDQDICDQCLKDFYSVMIKSSPEKLSLIDRLADQINIYVQYPDLSESLIRDILIHHLALFGLEKSDWLDPLASRILSTPSEGNLTAPAWNNPSRIPGDVHLLDRYLKLEMDFLDHQKPGCEDDISDYLSALSCWMSDQAISEDSRNKSGSPDISAPSNRNDSFSRYHIVKNVNSSSVFLDQYAYNMNLRKYITNPAIGREQELADLELILISPKKSPILIGEAGVGKTSIVEGLAYLMQKGDIPALLGDKIIYKLTTTSLLSGTKYVGEMEERMKALTDELMQHPEILLFIDEIHTIVGAGSTVSSHNDISNMLKPFIDRGDIKIIGATTKEEYEHFLLPDRALARRFYPIQVEEPDQAMTMNILLGTIPSIEYETKVHSHLEDREMQCCLKSLILISTPENQPAGQETRLPELPLSILEMAYSYAALHRRDYLEKEDFIRAVRHSNRLTKEARAAYKGPILP